MSTLDMMREILALMNKMKGAMELMNEEAKSQDRRITELELTVNRLVSLVSESSDEPPKAP